MVALKVNLRFSFIPVNNKVTYLLIAGCKFPAKNISSLLSIPCLLHHRQGIFFLKWL